MLITEISFNDVPIIVYILRDNAYLPEKEHEMFGNGTMTSTN